MPPHKRYSIPGKYTTSEAASLLGVSNTQVVQLIRSGELAAERTAGNAYLLDAQQLQQYQRLRIGRGRPWNGDTSWAALWMLSGLDADWLDYHQKRRLYIRLARMTAEELVWVMRKKATTHRLRASASFLEEIVSKIVPSGLSSNILTGIGLTTVQNQAEGYTTHERLDALITSYRLAPDMGGNLIVHCVDDLPFELAALKQMPEAVALVDLASSPDTRDRDTALVHLKELLNAQG